MKTILLVDDNDNFKIVLKDLLARNKNFHYKFIDAANPIEALEHYSKFKSSIDVVLCDFFLPVQNGSDLLEIIKQQSPMTKCLLISGDYQITNKKYNYVDQSFYKLDLDILVKYINNL